MNQVVLGALIPFALAAFLYLRRGCRATLGMLILTPVFMALTALWAVLPDLPRLFGCYDLYHRLSHDPRTNIFLWHYAVDQIEIESPAFNVVLFLLLAGLLASAWRELRLKEER